MWELSFATVRKFHRKSEGTVVRCLPPTWSPELPELPIPRQRLMPEPRTWALPPLAHLHCDSQEKTYLLSVSGMEIMTPFPVPTHKRLQDTMRAVILTKEKPSFPVPVQQGETFHWETRADDVFDYQSHRGAGWYNRENVTRTTWVFPEGTLQSKLLFGLSPMGNGKRKFYTWLALRDH